MPGPWALRGQRLRIGVLSEFCLWATRASTRRRLWWQGRHKCEAWCAVASRSTRHRSSDGVCPASAANSVGGAGFGSVLAVVQLSLWRGWVWHPIFGVITGSSFLPPPTLPPHNAASIRLLPPRIAEPAKLLQSLFLAFNMDFEVPRALAYQSVYKKLATGTRNLCFESRKGPR